MADPLTAIGGAAAVAHLAEVVGRLSKELYGFFWTIKDASNDLKRLRSALEDLEATVALLKRNSNHIVGPDGSSGNVTSNYGGESKIWPTMNTTIPVTLASLQRELNELKSRLPQRRVKGISIRLKWVLDKQRIMETASSVERHKSTLQLAMSQLGLQNDLLHQQTLEKMMQNLEMLKELPDQHQNVALKLDLLTANLSRLETPDTTVNDFGGNLVGVIRAELRGILAGQIGGLQNQTQRLTPAPPPSFLQEAFEGKAWCRFKNSAMPSHSIDVINDGAECADGIIHMDPTGNWSGQFWQIRPSLISPGSWNLCTMFLTQRMCLDVYGDDKTKPHLAVAGAYSGQQWQLVIQADGTLRLTNSYSGPNMWLSVRPGTTQLYMSEDDQDHWYRNWHLDYVEPITQQEFLT